MNEFSAQWHFINNNINIYSISTQFNSSTRLSLSYSGGTTGSSNLLDSIHYLPALFVTLYLIYKLFSFLPFSLPPSDLFAVFITESDILAAHSHDSNPEEESTPEPTGKEFLLPALTLIEATGWAGFTVARILLRKAEAGQEVGWSLAFVWRRQELRLEVLITLCWVFAFILAVVHAHRTRSPSAALLTLFCLLFSNSLIDISRSIHDYFSVPSGELVWALSRTLDLVITGVLISIIMVTPFSSSTLLKRNLKETPTRFLKVNQPASPEDANNMLGSLTYAWMDPIMSLARRRNLVPEDVWKLTLDNKSEVLSKKFSQLKEKTLLGKILHASARDIAIDATLKLVAVTLNYLRPYYIRRVLECLTSASSSEIDEVSWTDRQRAYVFAGLAVVVTIGRTLVEQRHYHHARRIGMRLRSEITVAVFEKSLTRKDMSGRMTGKDEEEGDYASVGKVISLISEDTNRVLRMGCDSHLIYGAPLEITLALLSLYDLMGWSALIGFVILAISAPINYELGKRSASIARSKSSARDKRQASVSELVSAVQTIKFFGWQGAWIKKVQDFRKIELDWLFKECVNRTWVTALWAIISLAVPLSAFFCFVKIQKEELTVAIAFTALALFGMVRGPLNQIPEFGIKILQTNVSINRIDSYLKEDDVAPHATPEHRKSTSNEVMGFENATLQWHENNSWKLKDLTIEFPRGELTVICGPTAAGKSAILLALLGEMDVASGHVRLPLSVSYTCQHPWLESTSIRANILFGFPFDRKRYEATLDACALNPDLEMLPERDATHVGERGVALSGGQKARIALARAVYAPSKNVLLDDVLSAVDSHTANHLYRRVLQGDLLRGRTCILVTHHVELVAPSAALLVVMEDGIILSQGPPKSMPNLVEIEKTEAESSASEVHLIEPDIPKSHLPGIVVAPEKWTTGEVAFSMYHAYLRAGSYLFWGILMLLVFIRPVLSFCERFWLRLWGEASSHGGAVDVNRFLAGYAGIAAASSIALLVSTVLMFFTSLKASTSIFNALLVRVVCAPPRWFDVTPQGRITNRFTNDISTVDESLASDFSNFAANFVEMMVALIVTTAILPVAFIPVAAFALVYFFLFIRYLGVNRDVNRIAATSASPLFSGFQEALIGITTIRAFAKENEFRADICAVVDATLSLWYCSATLAIWLSIRSQLLAACCLLATSFFAIYAQVSPGLAGIAITSSLSIIQSLDWLCSSYSRVVMGLNSLERISEYLELPQEPSDGISPPASWPSAASSSIVDVNNLSIRYSPDLPEVLHDITFSVKPGERIAVAGRTGSGKSTLAMSLLRFVDPTAGSIYIDGLDITNVALNDLRQRVTFLPQDAVLFSGTVRDNLDPLLQYTDGECFDALRRVHLHSGADSAQTSRSITPVVQENAPISVSTSPGRPRTITLDTAVTGGGGNLSSGQRQLVALARALLRDSRIIIFDESTASIDFELDRKIQETIRTEFVHACLITIAHRLRTVIDFDRVMCLEAGRIVEFDEPAILLQREDSVFHRLCRESGDYAELLAMAKEKGNRLE